MQRKRGRPRKIRVIEDDEQEEELKEEQRIDSQLRVIEEVEENSEDDEEKLRDQEESKHSAVKSDVGPRSIISSEFLRAQNLGSIK